MTVLKPFKRVLCVGFVLLFFSSCSHYRIVPLYVKENTTHYAVAYNGILVPELTVDERGAQPTSKNVASLRLEQRRDRLESAVRIRYAIPRNSFYQAKRIPLSIGLIVVSPVVIPILYFSDVLFGEEEHDSKSFAEAVGEYIVLAVHEPLDYEVSLKNEFEIVSIHAD